MKLRVKGTSTFDCESGNYIITKEELEDIAKKMIGTPVYDAAEGVASRKVVGHVIQATVEDDHIDTIAEVEVETKV